jgi:cytochrome c biogenesis protein CcmG, thiol:disulfide interchange protein DsbE
MIAAMAGLRRRMSWGLAAVFLAAAVAAQPAAARDPVVGQIAPNFQVTTLDGQKLSLSDFKGEVVVLNFWATWCGPCKVELPLLNAYYKARARYGLRVLAVTTQDSLPLADLKPLAAALAIPMVRDLRGPYGTLEGVPTNYVIDRDGVLRYGEAGAFSLDDLNTILTPLLNRQAPAEPAALVSPAKWTVPSTLAR